MWRNFLWPICALRKQWQGMDGMPRQGDSEPVHFTQIHAHLLILECYHLPVRSFRAKRVSSRVTGRAHVPSLLHLQLASQSSPWHSWLQTEDCSWIWVSLVFPPVHIDAQMTVDWGLFLDLGFSGVPSCPHRCSDDCRYWTVSGSGFLWCSLLSTHRCSDDCRLRTVPGSGFLCCSLVSTHRRSDDCRLRTVPGFGFLCCSLVSTHRRSDDCRLWTVPGSGFLWCSLLST